MRAQARHILVPTIEACQELKTQIEDGGDFAALAKQHSKCPSGKQGGEFVGLVEGVDAPADISVDATRSRVLIPLFKQDAVRIQGL